MSAELDHQSLFMVMVVLAGTFQGFRLQTRAASTSLGCRTKLMYSASGSVQHGRMLAPAPNGTMGAAKKSWKLQECINDKSLAEIAQFLAEAERRVDPAIRGGL